MVGALGDVIPRPDEGLEPRERVVHLPRHGVPQLRGVRERCARSAPWLHGPRSARDGVTRAWSILCRRSSSKRPSPDAVAPSVQTAMRRGPV